MNWISRVKSVLVGRTIKDVRFLSTDEALAIGWASCPVVIVLDDGQLLIPSMDPEGNGPGVLFTTYRDFPVVG